MFDELFAKRHSFRIVPAQRGTRVQYVCSCGARGWTTPSTGEADRMGRKHVAMATERARAKAKANPFKFKI